MGTSRSMDIYAERMSTRSEPTHRPSEPGQTSPKARRYRIAVVGVPPNDLSDTVSALHAGAVKHQLEESHRTSISDPDIGEAQP